MIENGWTEKVKEQKEVIEAQRRDIQILAGALNKIISLLRRSPLNADRMRAIRNAETALEVANDKRNN
jgi:hypothetical protein